MKRLALVALLLLGCGSEPEEDYWYAGEPGRSGSSGPWEPCEDRYPEIADHCKDPMGDTISAADWNRVLLRLKRLEDAHGK